MKLFGHVHWPVQENSDRNPKLARHNSPARGTHCQRRSLSRVAYVACQHLVFNRFDEHLECLIQYSGQSVCNWVPESVRGLPTSVAPWSSRPEISSGTTYQIFSFTELCSIWNVHNYRKVIVVPVFILCHGKVLCFMILGEYAITT